MEDRELIPHLFRTEYRKIVSVLCRKFGLAEMEVAEDIASETFLTATQTWGVEGTPVNPTAWLYSVARNKASNLLRRHQLFEEKIRPQLENEVNATDELEIDLTEKHVDDSQLQMMFALCHPLVSQEAQVGLCLRILCGFGIEEIADAFLTSKETINKRLLRARDKLREENIKVVFPESQEIEHRLERVLTTIYLLFNEGYYSITKDQILRKDLCLEAIRLCTMLVENKLTDTPPVNALLSLMCFHASRFDARFSESGEVILYNQQDTSLWNADWIAKGGYFLHRAGRGGKISTYHLEAGIAYWNTQRDDTPEKWERILEFYDKLLDIKYTPVAALNRTYALSKAKGNDLAIPAAEKLNLTDNFFYFSLLGELYIERDAEMASRYFEQALSLAKTSADKNSIQKRLNTLYN
ncbi:MAG TPA: sigma-70 family RNA polymerase sigma factor [Chryseolinea sp.]|nr:sigma-70 family RNA polymerase sigma factor [Chryseolinea sp.]